jgi:chromosome partitioning protein
MQRILVINPKGGSGKTTVAVNLASHFALLGERPVLMDYDRQASAGHWIKKRHGSQPQIGLVAAYEVNLRVTRAFQLRVPPGTGRVIIDTPAAISPQNMPELTRTADKILVPVLPSDIDIHACSRCVQNLLLVAKVQREENRIGIIANRVRRNTLVYRSLTRFLDTLGIPIVATLRDSQSYIRGAESGLGLGEMHSPQTTQDLLEWQPLLDWLDQPPGSLPISRSASLMEQMPAQDMGPESAVA